jgi:uncharacterized membrane protein
LDALNQLQFLVVQFDDIVAKTIGHLNELLQFNLFFDQIGRRNVIQRFLIVRIENTVIFKLLKKQIMQSQSGFVRACSHG